MNLRRQQENLIGQADSFLSVLDQVSRLAATNRPVLVIGERGTGKELIAARLHYLSPRWEHSYLTLNCAALNENLLESELFGYEAGAFTGATKKHAGRFERANQGSLFLDELANTSSLVQEKLLRVIEYGEFERVGGSQLIKTDVRLIAATNEDLPTLAQQGQFRPDLLDRLAFDVVTLPPLRYRQEDILILAEHFAVQMARELKLSQFAGFTQKAQKQLEAYAWPGNVRELKNVIERSLYRHKNENLPLHDIIFNPFESPWRPQSLSAPVEAVAATPRKGTEQKKPLHSNTSLSEPTQLNTMSHVKALDFEQALDFKQLSQNFEKEIIQQALNYAQFNQRKTAEILGLTYHQLRGHLKKYDLL